MLMHCNRKLPTRALSPHSHSSQTPLPKQPYLKQQPNQQNRSDLTPARNASECFSAKMQPVSGQKRQKGDQGERLLLKLVQSVYKFTKAMEGQMSKRQDSPCRKALWLRLDGLMLHRLREIRQTLAQIKIMHNTPNPQLSPDNAHCLPIQQKTIAARQARTSSQAQMQSLRQQLAKWLPKLTSQHHLSASDLSGAFKSLMSRAQQLQREKQQLQTQIKKTRLFYLNQIDHCKQEVRFVHQAFGYQEQQLKELESQSTHLPLAPVRPPREVSARPPREATVLKQQEHHAHFQQETNVLHYQKEVQIIGQNAHLGHFPQGQKLAQTKAEYMAKLTEMRLQEYEQLLMQMKVELEHKGENLMAMSSEITLLEDNLSDLSEKVQARQELLSQRQQCLQELQRRVQLQREQLASLQSKAACLAEEAQIQQQNVDYVQQQLEFLEDQRQLYLGEIQELQRKRTELQGNQQ